MRASRSHPPAPRPGYSLIELLLVLGIVSLVLASIAVALHSLMRVSGDVHRELADARRLPRLSVQWRSDAHAAERVELTEDELILHPPHPPGARTTWTRAPQRLVRRVLVDDQEVHREVFDFGPGVQVSWELDEQPVARLRLRLVRQRGRIAAAADAQATSTFEAAVNLRQTTAVETEANE